jgi:hypothetical protein
MVMELGVCFCTGSMVKLGGPSVEPEPRKHPDCSHCGRPAKIVEGLSALAREAMLFAIDKCIWWPEYLAQRPMTHAAAAGMAEEILVHLRAGRERVSSGESFDSYSEAF